MTKPYLKRQKVGQLTDPQDTVWNDSTISRVVSGMSVGEISEASVLAQGMASDAVYATVKNKRLDNLFSREFRFVANNKQQQLVIPHLKPLYPLFQQQLRSLVAWYHDVGHAVGYLDWSLSGMIMVPKLCTLHPYYSRWDSQKRRWYQQLRQEPMTYYTPGDGKWVELGDSLDDVRQSAVKALARSYLTKIMARAYQIWNLENRSALWLHSQHPANATNDDRNAFMVDIRDKRGPLRFIETPKTSDGEQWSIDPIDLASQGPQAHDEVIEKANKDYTVWFLGSNLGTDVSDKGSFAATQAHLTVEEMKAMNDARMLGSILAEQVVLPYIKANIDRYATLESTPIPSWNFDEPDDVGQRVSNAQAFVELIDRIRTLGLDVGDEVRNIGSQLGIKVPETKTKNSETEEEA